MSIEELKTKFLHAETLVNDNKVQVPESLKMKLYGLGKQIKEGDCKMPQPPATNTILKAKWDAWTSCSGMSIEKSMQEYTSLVDRLEPHVRNADMKMRKSVAGDGSLPAGVRKAGTLFKQRDLFKGWRPRHFVLQDNFLHYYLEADDPAPRNTLDLSGCSVTTSKAVIVDGAEYFPFAISHPKSKTPYHLSSDSKLDADTWVAMLIEAANTPVPTPAVTIASPMKDSSSASSSSAGVVVSETSAKRPAIDSTNETHQSYFYGNTAHGPETRAYIPPEFLPKVEKQVQVLLDKLSPDAQGWEPMFEKDGLVAKKCPGSIMRVKAEITLPYCLYDVFTVVLDGKRQTQLDPQRLIHEKFQEFSNHTWADYIRFKGVWPTSPRDMVNLAHWRLLNDGRVVVIGYAEKFDERPAVEGHVRAETVLGGFVFTPQSDGTKVSYLVETDLKGTLPASVVNLASNSQPLMLASIRKVMAREKKEKGAFSRPINSPVDYGELVSFINSASYDSSTSSTVATGDNKATAATSSTASSSSSSSAAAADKNAVPIQRKATLLKFAAKYSKINTIGLLMLFFPPMLYFIVDSNYRAVGFLAGLLITARYLIKKHLGKPITKIAQQHLGKQLPASKVVFRFPVELGRLLLFVDSKRKEFDLEMTLTHMAIKASAIVIHEMPTLNGNIILDEFYRARSPGVDVSVGVAVTDTQTVAIKVEDAEAKPVEFIADEVMNKSKALRAASSSDVNPAIAKLNKILPANVVNSVQLMLHSLGARYGIAIPAFGVTAFPLGVCTVVSSSAEGDSDLDMAVVPNSSEASAPITVAIGGIRVSPNLDVDRKITGAPVLNIAVTIDSRVATPLEGRKFCSRLQDYLSDPLMLEQAHQKYQFEREEAAKRKTFFGGK